MQKIEITTHHSADQLGLFYWTASRPALAPFSLSLSLPDGFVRLSFPGYHGGAALSHALLFCSLSFPEPARRCTRCTRKSHSALAGKETLATGAALN